MMDNIDFVTDISSLFILEVYRLLEQTVVDDIVIWDFFLVSLLSLFPDCVCVWVGCVCMRSFVRKIGLEGDIHVCIIFIVDEQK